MIHILFMLHGQVPWKLIHTTLKLIIYLLTVPTMAAAIQSGAAAQISSVLPTMLLPTSIPGDSDMVSMVDIG